MIYQLLLIPPLFVAIWYCNDRALQRFGPWSRLAREYPAPSLEWGYDTVGGVVGWQSIRHGMKVRVKLDGVHLDTTVLFKPWHAPMFIPWEAVRRIEAFDWLGAGRGVRLEVGEGRTRIMFPARLLPELGECEKDD